MTLNNTVVDLVGNTPLVRLRTGVPDPGPQVYVKLEFFNPTGSVKDRMAYYIVREAMKSGELKAGDTVIDNSSGNTGSSLAMVAAVFGLRCIITTPDKTSQEKVDLIRSYGAELIITPTDVDHQDPEGYYMVARNLAKKHGYFDLDQYNSQKNVEAHYHMTGPELWKDTGGQITHFVCGIGTGGTFSGASRYLKEQNPNIRTIAVDTEGSVFASFIRDEELPEPQVYQIEGIGSDVVTEALHKDVVDAVITVSDKDAFNRARLIARSEGISGGGSSGAVAVAIEQVAAKLGPDAYVVGIFADGGIRYLSKCYNDEWMRQRGYLDEVQVQKKR
jgi:cystathionine beta-synthase